ncbi:flagellar biosynthesis protein FlhF [Paenibacillus sp. 481]|uniref:flagellar biosynthesis protein FlhF n=1 Tax=Paenibacillus sp. 481 TaxID=2835869 RepID=UPI001E516F9B|nr:flagellar biosynthesis protein FlhF [Paenibacillus sp. 481]UHA73920.1 flagellar biosynthesis protein FlhF [Paenibacillus sp. 481]
MRVKRYLVETMPEAMSQIRQELGKDAVIISTKEIKVGGFLGMFRKRCIEVVAAVDEQASAAVRPAAQPSAAMPQAAGVVPPVVARNAYSNNSNSSSGYANGSADVRQGQSRSNDASVANGSNGSTPVSTQRELLNASAHLSSNSKMSVGALPHSTAIHAANTEGAAPTGAAKSVQPEPADATVRDELREMKQMMEQMMRQANYEAWPEAIKRAEQHLIAQGVLPDTAYGYAQQVWDRCCLLELKEPDERTVREQLRIVLRELLSTRHVAGIAPSSRIVCLVGPTGVGKTTTIAKLAADQMFHHRRKVGLITSDTYRISAVEQLRTYASILNVPLEVVTSPSDTERAVNALRDCDLILMDTAGRNYRNDLFVNELHSMLKPLSDSETYLVLSLTAKTADMTMLLEQFSKQPIERIVFTKADETDTYGAYVNIAERTNIPFSYVTTGQNVPDDLKLFEAEDVIRLLLGE